MNSMKALIMDADPRARDALAKVLTSAAWEPIRCGSISEASSAFESDCPPLVLVTCDAADGAGLAFCRWVRSQTNSETVWVLALLTKANCEHATAALTAGANDLLPKSADEPQLRLRLALAERQLRSLQEQSEEKKAQEYRFSTRAHQQTAIAALGQCAVVNVDLTTLMVQAATFLTQILEVEYCGILQLLPETGELALIEGTGWRAGSIGVRIAADSNTAEGLALREEPVIVPDWTREHRFRMPLIEREHHIRSSLNVVLPGPQDAFGILGAHTIRPRVFSEDEVHFLKAVAIVLSLAIERHRSEAAIQRLAAFARCNPNPVLEFNADVRMRYINQAAEAMAQSIGRSSVLALLPEDHQSVVQRCLDSGNSHLHQETALGRRTVSWSFFPIRENQAVHCYAEEITSRLDLETQLRQLQKMECVGQLAAGLAHDFNNVLTIIRGHADILLLNTNLSEKKVASLDKIVGAVERASNLTRQLLTFSRRQIMQPVPLDLNDCVASLAKMLDRTLGENIELTFEPSRDLPSVLGDTGMIDQVVMNLAVNARDAMPKGGRLVITTSLLEIDDAYVRRHSEARAGKFVCLSVTDTGCGMDASTLSHIFEPFFTTKGVGKGTGLGLATVYGIAKQHQGWIEVVSEVGRGTTFLIFLPCCASAAVANSIKGDFDRVCGGTETILLAEDEQTLRELARMILRRHGYRVIEAVSGAEALKIWERQKDRIDLLLTDLVMPEGINGMELGQRLVAEKPNLKIIYTSGYSGEIIGKQALPEKVQFLQKPYPAQSLLRAVRECLDAH